MDYKKIDTQELNRMLLDRIQELEREGYVDHHFRECHSLKEDSGLSFFLDLIPVFFSDVFQVVKELAHALNQPVVNFREIYSQLIKLKGCSACFGACRIRDVCSNLRQAIDNKSKEGCIQALNIIEDECKSLRDRLDDVIKLEKEIVSRATPKS